MTQARLQRDQLVPRLTELDSINSKAKRIQVSFHVRQPNAEEGEAVGIDSSGLKYGWGVGIPAAVGMPRRLRSGPMSMSDAMLELAHAVGHLKVCFETVDVSSTKSPKGGAELRELVMRAIAEAFAQNVPPEEELAAATKKYRDAEREKGAAAREQSRRGQGPG